MGRVANVIISFSLVDRDRVQAINEFFECNAEDVKPLSLTFENLKAAGFEGERALEKIVLVGAYNYLNVFELKNFLELLGWFNPKAVQLLIANDEDDPHKFSDWLDAHKLIQRN